MNELTISEGKRLDVLEKVIDGGMEGFLAVGTALAEIRESRLYRASHATFEAYCKERWNFSADYGRKLTRAAEAIASLPDDLPKPTKASHARALADIPEEDREDAWRDALEEAEVEGREVKADDIRRAPKPKDEDGWLEEKTLGEENMEEVAPHVKAVLAALSEAAEAAEQLSRTSAKEWLLTSGSALLKHIRDARDHVNAAKPASLCPYCGGAGCRKCFDTGWVNRTRRDQAKK